MDDSRILMTLRHMAWERAKGELKSMLQTYWGNSSPEYQFKYVSDKIDKFIKDVEDNW